MPAAASDPVTALPGVGSGLAAKLSQLGVERVVDLLLHAPLRYEDRTRVVALAALRPGESSLVVGCVEHAEIRHGRRRSLNVVLADGAHRVRLRFFHFGAGQTNRLVPGVWLQAFGEVRAAPGGLEMVHPETRVLSGPADGQAPTDRLTPVYPTTAGLTQARLRGLIEPLLARLEESGFLPESLPDEIRADQQLPPLAEALQVLHRPPADADIPALLEGRYPAVRRLAFEEMVAHQAGLRERRRRIRQRKSPRLVPSGGLLRQFLQQLGFEPTAAQRRVLDDVLTDIAAGEPMLRLVQGDVGSGKTLIAAAAAVAAAEAGWQTAFMAPTELLAEQHAATLAGWLDPLGLPVRSVIGGRTEDATRAALAGSAPLVAVGTHALFQSGLGFGRLGLTVVDEQHRFGVHQRLALRDQGSAGALTPHQLIMTATPIPRTLAMSAYADLDTSIIDELPPGRTPVTTAAVPATRRDAVVDRIAAACAGGRQAYWVCTLIEETEQVQARAAEATAEELTQALPDCRVGLAHGRMKSADKETVMRAFSAGEIDLLVATTVIEVGVDVPNASLMVIENAERLGLAQLHQLRGRVGRGRTESHCVLLYQPPLGELARRRLSALRATTDGFVIAREDLELRGPGEVLGTRQTGAVSFRMADVMRDADLAPAAQAAADRLLTAHPRSVALLAERWLDGGSDYASV
ncbi:MAG: ATP-dependent DNA helicase RecG [Salinisphaeraceae bacterium]